MRMFAVFALLLAVGGCHASSSAPTDLASAPAVDFGSTIPGLMSIDVSPPTASLTTSNGAVAQQAFTATGHFEDGHSADVTSKVTWTLADSDLGSFTSGNFTASTIRGGKTIVKASAGALYGTAQLAVRYVSSRVSNEDGSTAPANSNALFAAATLPDSTLAPSLVYPLDGVVVPVNLGEIEVQWQKAGSVADLFEVAFSGESLDLRVYTNAAVASGGRLSVLAAEWNAISRTVAGGNLMIRVTGMTIADPTKIGAATAITVTVDPDTLTGGIYYWSPTTQGVERHSFGDTSGVATDFYSLNNSGHCIGCHVLTRDGRKAAVTFDGNANGGSAVLDVASLTQVLPQSKGLLFDFAAFSPDGNKLVGTNKTGALTVYDTSEGPNQGAILGVIDIGSTVGYSTHPDWSPDGKHIVFTRADKSNITQDWDFVSGSIVVVTGPGDGTFSNPTVLVQSVADDNNYYPTFSPDSKWILYNHATSGSAYDNPTASAYVIATDGKASPIALTLANGAGGLTNSWPRWSPFVQSYTDGSQRMYYTFSSKRSYGIELAQPTDVTQQRPQIWMAAFSPALAATQVDPSSLPFWLPFQDLTTNNHIAQWTQAIVQ